MVNQLVEEVGYDSLEEEERLGIAFLVWVAGFDLVENLLGSHWVLLHDLGQERYHLWQLRPLIQILCKRLHQVQVFFLQSYQTLFE